MSMGTPHRIFTLAEANRTLPFVRRVVQDIVETDKQICTLYEQCRKFGEEGQSFKVDEIECQIRMLLDSRQEYVEELEGIGCEFKDFQLGLVDFPARLGDRTVYLCWRMGEPEIRFWHELRSGFASRQPIDGHFSSNGGAYGPPSA